MRVRVRDDLGAIGSTACGWIFLVAGGFMLIDAILSMVLVTDVRPIMQYGRVARGMAGLGLGVAGAAQLR